MRNQPKWASLVVFLVVVVGGGWVIGATNLPGSWYAGLAKPAFNPPDWLFPPVWTILYILIAFAGWRIWRVAPASLPMVLWAVQLILNFAWSPTFFGAHRPGPGLVVIVLLLCTILAFIAAAWRRDRTAALAFVPYAAWVAFASLLNEELWRLN